MSCARCQRSDVPVAPWSSPPYAGKKLCVECKFAMTQQQYGGANVPGYLSASIAQAFMSGRPLTNERHRYRDAILTVLVKHAPAELDAVAGKRRCVLATRVAVETLNKFGIEAEPLIVKVKAANASWLRVAKNPKATEADFLATDAHMIEIRTEVEEGERTFPAHLVARLKEIDSILDLDMKQFRRPGIEVADAASLLVPKEFFDGGRLAEYELPRGGAIAYGVLNDGVQREFKDAVDWKTKAAWFPIVRNLTLRIEAALKTINQR